MNSTGYATTASRLMVCNNLPGSGYTLMWLDQHLVGVQDRHGQVFPTILEAAEFALKHYGEWPQRLDGLTVKPIHATVDMAANSWAVAQKALQGMFQKVEKIPPVPQASRQRLVEIAEDMEEAARQLRIRIDNIAANDAQSMDTTQLSFTYNSRGYMLTYRGKQIGGASTFPKGTVRRNGAMKAADLQLHRTTAQVCISDIKAGRGQRRFLDAITKIDKGT